MTGSSPHTGIARYNQLALRSCMRESRPSERGTQRAGRRPVLDQGQTRGARLRQAAAADLRAPLFAMMKDEAAEARRGEGGEALSTASVPDTARFRSACMVSASALLHGVGRERTPRDSAG